MSGSTDEASVEVKEDEERVQDNPEDKLIEEESFTLVKGRGRRGHRTKKGLKLAASFNHELSTTSNFLERQVTETKEQVLRKIDNCVANLRQSQYYSHFLEKISIENLATFTEGSTKEFSSIYCLGLGPFSSHLLSRIARYQLALLILLQEKYQLPVELYDPIFSDQEKLILSQQFNFTVSPTNEQGHHLVTSPTLLFLPHCPHQLLNNLLYTNWSPENLPHLIIISNTLPPTTTPELYYLSKLSQISTEIPIPNTFTDDPSIFNDLSLQIFPPSKTHSTNLKESFWLDKPLPIYKSQDFK